LLFAFGEKQKDYILGRKFKEGIIRKYGKVGRLREVPSIKFGKKEGPSRGCSSFGWGFREMLRVGGEKGLQEWIVAGRGKLRVGWGGGRSNDSQLRESPLGGEKLQSKEKCFGKKIRAPRRT